MKLLNNYPISIINLTTLAILSIAITNVFQDNLFMYFVLFSVIGISNFTLEYAYNRIEDDRQVKAKKVGLITVPTNLTILVVFMMVAFV